MGGGKDTYIFINKSLTSMKYCIAIGHLQHKTLSSFKLPDMAPNDKGHQINQSTDNDTRHITLA